MRFSATLVAGLVAVANAQSQTYSASPEQASQVKCIADCPEGDVKCQSYCISVPSPNESQVIATTECVAKCDQGSGSEADTEKYKVCVDACISNNYWKTIDGTPKETGSSGNNNNNNKSGSDASKTGSANSAEKTGDSKSDDASKTGDAKSSGTATGAAAGATSSKPNGANTVAVGGVSLVSFFAAILAL